MNIIQFIFLRKCCFICCGKMYTKLLLNGYVIIILYFFIVVTKFLLTTVNTPNKFPYYLDYTLKPSGTSITNIKNITKPLA